MQVELTPRVEQLISERLTDGAYKSAAEVIEEAFDALAERDNFLALQAAIDHADEQLARGEYSEFDAETVHELAARIEARGRARLQEERQK